MGSACHPSVGRRCNLRFKLRDGARERHVSRVLPPCHLSAQAEIGPPIGGKNLAAPPLSGFEFQVSRRTTPVHSSALSVFGECACLNENDRPRQARRRGRADTCGSQVGRPPECPPIPRERGSKATTR